MSYDKYDRKEPSYLRQNIGGLLLISLIFAGIFMGVAAFTTGYSAGVSEAAILVDPIANTVSDGGQGPFWYPIFAKGPFTNVVRINLAVQTMDMWSDPPDTAPYPDVLVLSKDNLEVGVALSVRYQIESTKIVDLYRQFPDLSFKTTIEAIIRSETRDVVASFNAAELQVVRDELQAKLTLAIEDQFNTDTSLQDAINFVGLNLRDINLPASFLVAIESKLAAQQAFIQASFEAQRILLLANATAQAQILQAIGIAESQIIIATGTSEAINLIINSVPGLNNTETITEIYTFMTLLNELAASNPNTTFYFLLGSSDGQFFMLNPTP